MLKEIFKWGLQEVVISQSERKVEKEMKFKYIFLKEKRGHNI